MHLKSMSSPFKIGLRHNSSALVTGFLGHLQCAKKLRLKQFIGLQTIVGIALVIRTVDVRN